MNYLKILGNMLNPTWCRLLVALSAAGALADGGRGRIRLPDDCVFAAAEPGAPISPTARCAQRLVDLQAAFKQSGWFDQCGDWPNLELQAQGENVAGLKFWPLERGHFLVQVRCSSGAYNETSLFFRWNDDSLSDEVQLVVFASHDGEPTPRVFARDFDSKQRTLWAFRKMLGDGSGGEYQRFTFEGDVPVLRESVAKAEADGKNGWNFDRRSTPKGPGWVRKTTVVKGCLASLADPHCK